MGKKLHGKILFLLFFLPVIAWGQCPTSVSISADKGTNICSGTNVTFSADIPSGTYGTLNYDWQVNGSISGSGATFSSSSLQDGDNVQLIINSTEADGVTACSKSSNTLQMTVNQNRTGSVTIQASNSNICPGETVDFSIASVSNAGSGATYSWKVNNIVAQTGNNDSFSQVLSDGDIVSLDVISSVPCTPDFSSTNTITISEKDGTPGQPSTITGDANVCPGISKTYSVTNDPTVIEYIWTLPSGWTGSSSSNTINVITGTNSGDISVVAKNDCGSSTARTISITSSAAAPNTPGTISGVSSVCPGVTQTYSVDAVTNAAEYIWTFPSGWNNNNITVTTTSPSIDVTTGASGNNGNISVIAKNNCGDSSARTLSVSVKPGTPNTPGVLAGQGVLCPGITETYTIAAVAGATSYIWTLPSGFSSSSLITSNPTIDVTAGTSGSGPITVSASNDCGTSSGVASKTLTISNPAPVMTGSITGPTGVCANTTNHSYTIPAITNATSYAWTATSGLTINSGQGTNTITVSAGSSGGTLSVIAKNSCGDSSSQSITVNLNNPAPVMAGSITGPSAVCGGKTGLIYSIPAVTNATSYNWTFPGPGWTITSGAGTRSITVTAGTSSGNISVTATNSCGTSGSVSIPVTTSNAVPNQPGQITTNLISSKVCPVLENVTFEIPGQTGLTYKWILPTGFEITSGAGTRKITVKINSNTTYANNLKVEVEAVNACGSSPRRVFEPISVDNYVFADLGADRTVCSSTTPLSIDGLIKFGNGAGKLRIASLTTTGTNAVTGINYTTNYNDFTFNYTPSQTDLNNGQVTFSLITEKPAGACQAGTDELTVYFRPVPTASIAANSPICAGQTSMVTFTGTPETRVIYRIGNSTTDQTIDIGSSGTAELTTALLNATTTYNLRSIAYTTTPNCSVTNLTGSATVTVTQIPTATISYNQPFCTSLTAPQDVTLTGTNAYTGGTFSAPSGLSIDASTGAITPSTSTPDNYTITYTIPAKDGCETVVTTTEVSIQAKSVITSQPSGVRICEGEEAQFEVEATGESLTYQWYHNSVAAGNEVSGGTNPILNLSGVTALQAGSYIVVIGNTASCENVTSEPAALTVDQNIVITSQPISATVCTGDNTSLEVVANTGGANLDTSFSYQWYKGEPGSGNPISGAQSASLPLTNVDINQTGNYYVEISGPAEYECQSIVSDVAQFIVRETPTVEISGDTAICDGGSAEVYFTNGLANTVVTYSVNNNNTNLQTINLDDSGQAVLNTGTLVATSNSETSFIYEIISVAYADDPTCSNEVTGTATVTVAPNPAVTLAFPNDQIEFCTQDSGSYTPELTGTGTYSGGTFSASGLNIDPSNGSFTPADNPADDYIINYTIPAYGGCPEEVVSVEIHIYEEVVITSEPFNIGICSTNDAEFSVAASGDALTYQWYKVVGNPDIASGISETNDQLLNGETSATLSLQVATSADAGDYYVKIAGTNACTPSTETQVNSEVVSLNVDEDIIILEPAENVRVCEDSSQSVEFKFVAHADGAPLLFEWIYANGTPVSVNENDPEGRYISVVNQVSNYQNSGIDVYVGTLTINNIISTDQNSYAVRIDGSVNNFTCPEAISNSFDLDVDPLPNKPVVEPISYCVGDEAVALTATGENGATLMWYTSPTDPSPTETAPIPSTELVGTTSYFVTQKDTFCESEMEELVVTVNAIPAVPPLTPEEQNITYCLGATPSVLTATSSGANYTINWYGPNDKDLALAETPTPPTDKDGEIYYWVSQTDGNTCESEKVMITVDVINLPDVTITNSGETTICEGDSVTLTATDANDSNTPGTEFVWTWEVEGESATGAAQDFSPSVTTVYTVTATNDNGCVNTEQITINVDEAPVGGTITGPASVCESDPSGSLDLTGHSGIIDRWEIKPSSSSDWTAINEATPDANYQFSGLTETTSFRAILTNGVCDEVASTEITINIDPVPVAGGILFNSPAGLNRVFMMCEFPSEDYLVPLELNGTYIGNIISWQYRRNSQTEWTVIEENGENFTGNSLSGAQVNAASGNESTLFRVEVGSGACTPNVFSDYATLSVIPSDIAPSPVQITPGEVCLGEIVTMSSSTGYGGSGTFEGGAFDNSSIANHGWRVMRFDSQTEYTFESAADNVRPDRWMRTNPHDYQMAHPNGSGSIIYQRFDSCSCDDGNKGFAIVSGNNPSTLETPVFNLYTMENPELTFDQAYNLTYGDVIRVEISTDGGNTYVDEPLMEISGPSEPGGDPVTSGNYDRFGDDGLGEPNNMVIDLSKYAGLGNLRIRWLYDGTDGGIYTIDDIGLPEDPQNVQLIWYYDLDINDDTNPLEQIGEVNQQTVTYPQDGAQWPKIGWNDFEVQTALVFDTNGDPCESAENSAVASVYVFDNYTSTATAQVGECGNTNVQLSATITGTFQGEITEFPSGEGSTVKWEVVEFPEGYTYSDSHFLNEDPELVAVEDPNAIFQPPLEGNYKLRWTITPNESQTTRDILGQLVTQDISANPCPMTHIDTTFEFIDCTTLDFDGDNDYIDLGNTYNGNYFIEAWIRPFDRPLDDGSGNTDASTGTILSSPGFEITMEDLSAHVQKNTRWYHIAVSNTGQLWVDGVAISGGITVNGNGGSKTIVGAKWNSTLKETENHFSGWIEELRIWNKALTEKQIRFMMNQRLKLDGSGTVMSPLQGEVVPNLVIQDGGLSSYYTDGTNNLDQDGIPFFNVSANDLAGYYRLYSDEPDPANLLPGYFDNALEPANGFTPDHSLNKEPGRLYNITTNQENTSPTPYFSGNDGNWEDLNTWARPTVWDFPNSTYNGTALEWNIARINHDIQSANKDITMLGLLSETAGKELSINSSHFIRISHYLLLDGNMDLEGESQLLQDHGSILDNTSGGWAEIEQEGRLSSFNYNYWTSPFSIQAADNNSGFILNQVLFDGSNPNNPQPINFQNGYFVADGAKTSPITISNEWIWDFRGGDADIYGDWLHLGSDYLEIVGAGYSMKGTTGSASLNAKQNYVFRGKPNNGNIPVNELYLQSNQNFLVGNPYPSAIDAEQFLKENLVNVGTGSGINENGENVFNGTLYYWDHFDGYTHILEEYIGGYATYTLAGSAPAISNDWRINSGGGINNIEPKQYIPVAQGFFLNSAPVSGQNFSGDIIFKNTQRVYKTKSGGSSIFLQQEGEKTKGSSNSGSNGEDNRLKIRVKFESPKGYHRQILVTKDDNTSNGFDIGYDAPLIENNVEDMYWWFEEHGFVIQGVPSFEKEQILPLAIKTNEGGEFKIKIDKTENWPQGKELYLKDKLLDTVHDILQHPYNSTTDKAGIITDRFEIVFFKEQVEQDPDPEIPGPTDPLNPELPVIDDLVGISYSTFSRQVKISNFDLLEVDKVMVFDMGGKLIQIFDELPTEEEIRLGMQPVRSGVYIVKVFSEKGITDKKIIIK